MTQQITKNFEKTYIRSDIPEVRPGQTVKIHHKVKEGGKERIQVFEGMVISTRGTNGPNATFIVRKVSFGIGVEMIFPLYSPSIQKIEIEKSAKVRRAKLYYIREQERKMKDDKAKQEKAQKMMKQIKEDQKKKAEEKKAKEESAKKAELSKEKTEKTEEEKASRLEEKKSETKQDKTPEKSVSAEPASATNTDHKEIKK